MDTVDQVVMSLANVRRGPRPAPDRILLYGPEGVGKSTFAADAPEPIFLAAEDGIRHLDVASFPTPRCFDDLLVALRELECSRHEFKTVVLDTVDWVEPLIWDACCKKHNWEDIEAPGFGKGYNIALVEWRSLLGRLDRVRKAGMEVILLGHSQIRMFNNPAGADYDRYSLKLQRSAAGLVTEWADAMLFAIHEDFVKTAKDAKKAKGVSTGKRVVYTERSAAWDAKNRHGLPGKLPLSYTDYAAARKQGQPAAPSALYDEAMSLLERVAEDERPAIEKFLDDHKDNATKLAAAVTRLRAKVEEN
jgi:hypothetical protein